MMRRLFRPEVLATGWIVCLFLIVPCPTQAQKVDSTDRFDNDTANKAAIDFFETHIRPLLIRRCMECHSHETEINGGLSLDSKEDWSRGGDSGPAIQPQDWESSLFWKAVSYRDAHLQMPPDGKLSDRELDVLAQWLAAGAVDPRESQASGVKKQTGLSLDDAQSHWAYRSVSQWDGVPKKATHSFKTPIDAFLFQKWEDDISNPEGSSTANSYATVVSPVATQSVWVQRLYLDLTGLRPTWDEWNQWKEAKDPSEIVDHLLASPRFGEHFARQWMDQVRFAESLTLRGFVLPDAWRYRNYLIESFNRDKPYDQFVMEQVAGDLMTSHDLNVRQQQWIATTMLALGDTNLEEQDKKQLEMDHIDEQLDVIGKVFLGQTLGCARCHDHKFDPIPTRDYYALAGILKSSTAMLHDNVSNWVRVPLPVDSESQERYARAERDVVEKKKELDLWKQRLSGKTPSGRIWSVNQLEGIVVDDTSATKSGKWIESNHQKAYVGDGYLHDSHDRSEIKSILFEPNDLTPGRYRVRVAYSHGANRATNTRIRVWSADGEDLIRLDQRQEPAEEGLWKTLGEYSFEQGGKNSVEIDTEGADGHVIADAVQFIRIVTSGDSDSPRASPISERTDFTEEQIKERIATLEESLREANAILANRPMAMGVKAAKPVDLPIHVRGSVHQLGEIVPRGFLRCVTLEEKREIAPTSNGRLELGQWLVSPRNPLTARVYVNRVWDQLMGSGLVRTPDNFGTTGEQPTHPELLDWLTSRFIENGWSTKWLVREIVLSEAYRRDAVGTSEARTRDPENRYWTRSLMKRLTPESMRDNLLIASGELELSTGLVSSGLEGVYPKGLKEDYRYVNSTRHRSVFGPWFRNSPMEFYGEFDGANLSFSIAKRSRSTVVQQALFLWNSPWLTDRANKIATRLFDSEWKNASRERRVRWLFVSLLGREPALAEIEWTESVLHDESIEGYRTLVQQLVASIDFRFVD